MTKQEGYYHLIKRFVERYQTDVNFIEFVCNSAIKDNSIVNYVVTCSKRFKHYRNDLGLSYKYSVYFSFIDDLNLFLPKDRKI